MPVGRGKQCLHRQRGHGPDVLEREDLDLHGVLDRVRRRVIIDIHDLFAGDPGGIDPERREDQVRVAEIVMIQVGQREHVRDVQIELEGLQDLSLQSPGGGDIAVAQEHRVQLLLRVLRQVIADRAAEAGHKDAQLIFLQETPHEIRRELLIQPRQLILRGQEPADRYEIRMLVEQETAGRQLLQEQVQSVQKFRVR